jgi:hypothetical protein
VLECEGMGEYKEQELAAQFIYICSNYLVIEL